MLSSLTALDYVTLGQIMCALRSPRNARIDDYQGSIGQLMDWLETCDFPTTKAAAEVLKAATIPHKEGIIMDSAARELGAMISAIHSALEHESKTRQVIALNTGGVSGKLRSLPSKVTLTDTQRHLLDETIRCMECAAYRSAAVMGWNLSYDYIRRWMWDDAGRRASFNGKLTARTDRHGTVIYPTGVTIYEDFYTIKPVLGSGMCWK